MTMTLAHEERELLEHKKRKLKVLREMCIKLTDQEYEQINSCKTEKAVDNAARIIILSRWG